uniref:Uncharacterized protein n=1 Tax=Anopheles darlingi TaxID=43151 RepID=A0A2M4DHA5_ANODA
MATASLPSPRTIPFSFHSVSCSILSACSCSIAHAAIVAMRLHHSCTTQQSTTVALPAVLATSQNSIRNTQNELTYVATLSRINWNPINLIRTIYRCLRRIWKL